MRGVLQLALLMMSLATTAIGQSGDQPPAVIDSLVAFECSLLSNDFNIQNLTKAFFPTNRHPALAVEVYYQTVSPDFFITQPLENVSNSTQRYEFRWFASAILGFIDPGVLTGFSLHTLTVEIQHADLVIAPFISDDEDWIRGLLSDATTLVSYICDHLCQYHDICNIFNQHYAQFYFYGKLIVRSFRLKIFFLAES